MDLIFLFKALLKRIWILLTIPLLATICAFVLTMDTKRLYKSEAQLATGFTVQEQISVTGDKFNIRDADIKFNNLIATLNSPLVLGLLSYKLLLNDLQSKTPFREVPYEILKERSFNSIALSKAQSILQEKIDSIQLLSSFQQSDREVMELLKIYNYDYKSINESLVIRREGYTDYVSLTFYSENPELSAFAINNLCTEFFRYSNSLRSKLSVESLQTFSNLVEKKRLELDEKSEALRRFKSSQGVLNFRTESEGKIEQISQTEKEKREEEKKISAMKFELAEINRSIRELENGYSNKTHTNAEIIALREQISTLNQQYMDSGSNDGALARRIEGLREELRRKMSGSNPSSYEKEKSNLRNKKRRLEVDMAIANQNLMSIDASLSALKSTAGNYASKEAAIATLTREVELATQEYLNAQEKYNTTLNGAVAAGSSVKQALMGQPAADPEPSKRLFITILSGLTGFTLCTLAVIFVEYVDVSIKTPSFFSKVVKLNLIGSVNRVSQKDFVEDVFKKNNKKDLATYRELLRKIRYEIEASGKKVFLFTSTKSGEGKSMLIRTLAQTFSISRKRVLIIDTNFANNELTNQFKAIPAFESFISKAPEEFKCRDIKKIISHTGIIGVDIIGCKGGDYSPSEVIPPQMLKQYLACLSAQYNYIFLEGASLNQHSDSKELVQYVDGVISVFSAKSVVKQNDKESINFLQNLNGKFTGAVLNHVEVENIDQ